MKATILVAALPFLCSVGCTSRQSEQLTQQQTDQVVSEVKAVGDSLMARFVRLDGAGGFQFFANIPHWVMFNADGTQWDYETTRKGMTDSVNAFASYKYHTLHEDYWVVNKDLVIGAWVIKDEYTMKSGDKMTYDQHPPPDGRPKLAGAVNHTFERAALLSSTVAPTFGVHP